MRALAAFTLWIAGAAAAAAPASARDAAADPQALRATWQAALAANDLPKIHALLRPGSRALVSRKPEVLAATRFSAERAQLAQHGDYAAFSAPRSLPLLMRREDGAWRVDLVEVLKSYVPAAAGAGPPPTNGDNPYAKLAAPPRRAQTTYLEEQDLFAEPLEDALARLAEQKDPFSQTRLAEILLRNCWLVEEALDRFEAVARAEATDYAPTKRLALRAWAAGFPERAIELAERFEPDSYDELAKLHARAGRYDVSQKYMRLWVQRRFGIVIPNANVPAEIPHAPEP